MNRRTQLTPPVESRDRAAANTTPSPDHLGEPTQAPSAPQGKQEANSSEGAAAASARWSDAELIFANNKAANPGLRALMDKLLIEGSTFEDVVEAANEQGENTITLNWVRCYFRANPQLQAKRMRYLVETAESLLKGLGDPKSAEERLARAAYLEAYLKLHREEPPVELKDAEHARMERANLDLKHKLVVVQRDKARQALTYSKERTRILVLTQEKLRGEISNLQQAAKAQKAGEPMGPAMLQKIQQLYGLACQPQLYAGGLDAANA